jgi:hypothetical protein
MEKLNKLEEQLENFDYVRIKMNQEGFDYCFKHYSSFEDVKDENFHKLRKKYIKVSEELEGYVYSKIDSIQNEIDKYYDEIYELTQSEEKTLFPEKLGLINYEGDCLVAIKSDNVIIIKDQYGVELQTITVPELYGFIDGLINIVDSKGKWWNFQSEHKDAKPSYSMIYNFVKTLNKD